MSGIGAKVRHVRGAGQDRRHTCHWPGCDQQVPPAMWGCKAHWFKLPKRLRDEIWRTYRPGQESDMRPSQDYPHAAREVQKWIAANAPAAPQPPAQGELL